jgi:hypothetical protein
VGQVGRVGRVGGFRRFPAQASLGVKHRGVLVLACTALIGWHLSVRAQEPRLHVTNVASSLVQQGLAAGAPTGSAADAFETVPVPGVQFKPNVARATNVPWIDSNGWRFERGARKVNYAKLPVGSAALAAAEAYAFGVEAILNPDPADVDELTRMLRFLKTNDQAPLPAMANIGVIDDRSPGMGEILNLLTRGNLLYRVVSKPDPTLDLTLRLGTADFPATAAGNPYDFAARVRAKLGDDKRLVRLYGTNTVIARLTGDRTRARLYLLSYSASRRQQRDNPQAIRVRVLGRYQPAKLAAYGAEPDAALTDIRNPKNATEFWVPDFNVIAIVDLKGA